MSGNVEFDQEKFEALADYIWTKQRMPSEKLAWLMFNIDFDHYSRFGTAVTGATYLCGKRHPEVQEVGIGWFQRFVRNRTPLWAQAVGWLLTAYVLLRR